ncbi:hypothetical protein BD779DRAFT_55229 [Infundibulicybe gibba]|nr:hypothetical protein BD779DRAFT_55229 [Infundibulicybe gibba]
MHLDMEGIGGGDVKGKAKPKTKPKPDTGDGMARSTTMRVSAWLVKSTRRRNATGFVRTSLPGWQTNLRDARMLLAGSWMFWASSLIHSRNFTLYKPPILGSHQLPPRRLPAPAPYRYLSTPQPLLHHPSPPPPFHKHMHHPFPMRPSAHLSHTRQHPTRVRASTRRQRCISAFPSPCPSRVPPPPPEALVQILLLAGAALWIRMVISTQLGGCLHRGGAKA